MKSITGHGYQILFFYLKWMVSFFIVLAVSCKETSTKPKEKKLTQIKVMKPLADTVLINDNATNKNQIKSLQGLPDSTFIRLVEYSKDFAYDMRYATENNFLKAKVYDCAECYTRVKTAKALLKANKAFIKQGYKIQFFDCYRPNSVQYKMWAIVPNPQYVANPKKGSIHNKGGAVDITLITLNGDKVDMGTDFDFFGKKAYHDNVNLPKAILDNRKVLKETMEQYGFWSIRTEWWHYNLSAASNDPIANFKWPCE